jgi:alkanesulfonate monooxygenase SsuD/methylene tetrahydromethanopterin reductase-like flavin-dependent oxidoreductase (luciferase family)
MGLARQPEHDKRYEIAEEYMQIIYKLWEGSWEDGAVLRDHAQRVFAQPERVHRIRHDRAYFHIEAIHLCEPSRSARRCSIKPARPRAGANSPRPTLNACSSTGPRSR